VSYRLSDAPNIVTPTAAVPKVENPLLNMVKRGEDANPTETRKNSGQKLDGVSYRLSEAPNIVTPTAAIPKVQNPLLNTVKRGEGTNPTEARKNVAAPSVNASLVKNPNVYRVSQMKQVRATIKETERVTESKKSGSGANSVIDARTNVTNNANTINHIRPNLVNPDMTFNKILRTNFSH
jgi:hypothetical protein